MAKRRKYYQSKARHPTNGVKMPTVKNSGYSEGGASHTRAGLRAYNPIKSSTQADVDANLSTLRNRSSDLFCNSPIGSAALNVARNNTIGAGLKVSPKIDYRTLGITAEQAKEWQRNTQREFELWAGSTSCDLYRKNNFYDMQDVIYLSYLMDGDGWAQIKYRPSLPDSPYCLRIQLFEASRVCNPYSASAYSTAPYLVEMSNPKNGNRIVNGVEINSDGAVIAYWIASRVPMDLANPSKNLEWTRVEAFGRRTGRPNVLQISHEERPEQYRGVPYLAPVIEIIKQISRYANAELIAAVIKSYFAIFFTSNTGETNDIYDVMDGTGGEKLSYDEKREILDGIDLAAGSANLLPEGIDVEAVDGSRTMSTFEPFTNALVTQVGAALNIPADVLMSRFQASYSASRGALLQAAALFKTRRTWFVRDFCQPVYEAWLAEAVAIGRVRAPGYGTDPLITKAWSKADWFGPVMGMLDPVKEVTGAALRRKYGFSSGEREAAELTGSDYDDNIDQIALENATWEKHGLSVPVADNTGKDAEGGDTKNE